MVIKYKIEKKKKTNTTITIIAYFNWKSEKTEMECLMLELKKKNRFIILLGQTAEKPSEHLRKKNRLIIFEHFVMHNTCIYL